MCKQNSSINSSDFENQKKFVEYALNFAVDVLRSTQDKSEKNEFCRKKMYIDILNCIDILKIFEITAIFAQEGINDRDIVCSCPDKQEEIKQHIAFFVQSDSMPLAVKSERGILVHFPEYNCDFFVYSLHRMYGQKNMFIGVVPHNVHISDEKLSLISFFLLHCTLVLGTNFYTKRSCEECQKLQDIFIEQKNVFLRSSQDNLTGLGNRVRLIQELEAYFVGDDEIVALLMLDINKFREVNDSFGHLEGDNVLVLIAQRLEQKFPYARLVVRDSGDEFAILSQNLTCFEDAQLLAEQVSECFKKPFMLSGTQLFLDASIGLVLLPDEAANADEAVARAKVAMYRAKKECLKYCFYEESFEPFSVQRVITIADMEKNLQSDGFFYLAYQPKVNLQTGKVVGVEALLRWNRPAYGEMNPALFVPHAEATGNIKKMGMMVVRQTVAQAAKWYYEGLELPIAINFSMLNLQDTEFCNRIVELIKTYKIPPSMIEIEVMESIIIAAPSKSVQHLKLFKDLGIKIYIDDFGTGYSTFGYLAQLPVSSLKIDSSFVIPMRQDENCRKIVETIIQLGHSLNLEIVAECIEDKETYDALGKMQCDVGQGYFICRPQRAEVLEEWIQKRLSLLSGD